MNVLLSLRQAIHRVTGWETDETIKEKRQEVHDVVSDVTGQMLTAGAQFEQEKRRFMATSAQYQQEMESVAKRIATATGAQQRGYNP